MLLKSVQILEFFRMAESRVNQGFLEIFPYPASLPRQEKGHKKA